MTVICVCMHTPYLGSTSLNEKKKRKENLNKIEKKTKLLIVLANYWLHRQYGCQSKHLKYRYTLFHYPINISLYDTCWSIF